MLTSDRLQSRECKVSLRSLPQDFKHFNLTTHKAMNQKNQHQMQKILQPNVGSNKDQRERRSQWGIPFTERALSLIEGSPVRAPVNAKPRSGRKPTKKERTTFININKANFQTLVQELTGTSMEDLNCLSLQASKAKHFCKDKAQFQGEHDVSEAKKKLKTDIGIQEQDSKSLRQVRVFGQVLSMTPPLNSFKLKVETLNSQSFPINFESSTRVLSSHEVAAKCTPSLDFRMKEPRVIVRESAGSDSSDWESVDEVDDMDECLYTTTMTNRSSMSARMDSGQDHEVWPTRSSSFRTSKAEQETERMRQLLLASANMKRAEEKNGACLDNFNLGVVTGFQHGHRNMVDFPQVPRCLDFKTNGGYECNPISVEETSDPRLQLTLLSSQEPKIRHEHSTNESSVLPAVAHAQGHPISLQPKAKSQNQLSAVMPSHDQSVTCDYMNLMSKSFQVHDPPSRFSGQFSPREDAFSKLEYMRTTIASGASAGNMLLYQNSEQAWKEPQLLPLFPAGL